MLHANLLSDKFPSPTHWESSCEQWKAGTMQAREAFGGIRAALGSFWKIGVMGGGRGGLAKGAHLLWLLCVLDAGAL